MMSISIRLFAVGIAVTVPPLPSSQAIVIGYSVAQAAVPTAPDTAPISVNEDLQKPSDQICAGGAKPADGTCNGIAGVIVKNQKAAAQESRQARGITQVDALKVRESGQQALTRDNTDLSNQQQESAERARQAEQSANMPTAGSAEDSLKSPSASAATAGERKQQLLADAGALLDHARLVDHDYAPGGDQATKSELEKSIDEAKSDLDSMSEMGEMESLRLQMAMDRLSKMMSTLSNILKKIDDTEKDITQNLK